MDSSDKPFLMDRRAVLRHLGMGGAAAALATGLPEQVWAQTQRDTLIIAEIDRASNTVEISAKITPPEVNNESAVYNTNTPEPVKNRIPLTGNSLFVHLDDKLVDLDKEVIIKVNGKQAFKGKLKRQAGFLADDIARHGDPGRIFPGRVEVKL